MKQGYKGRVRSFCLEDALRARHGYVVVFLPRQSVQECCCGELTSRPEEDGRLIVVKLFEGSFQFCDLGWTSHNDGTQVPYMQYGN
jgi:hypothetical protein